jgi:hypothetical protein
MKLVPRLKFWGRKQTDEESDLLDEFPEETLPPPPEDEEADSEDEEAEGEEEKEEGEAEENQEEEKTRDGGADGLLNVFTSVEEEFVDNSALTNEIEDVPAAELLDELRGLAVAFGAGPRRSAGIGEGPSLDEGPD